MSDRKDSEDQGFPRGTKAGKIARGALQIVGGAIPLAGGTFSAISNAWSESEQEKVNRFFEYWSQMLKDELQEKERTIVEIMARIDLTDERISQRIESPEFQSLVRKTFREWSGAESEEKRVYIRNILSNAATVSLTSDDVIRMFITWINQYSEMHFHVIGAIYNSDGITRGAIWRKIGKGFGSGGLGRCGFVQATFSRLEYWRCHPPAPRSRLLWKLYTQDAKTKI